MEAEPAKEDNQQVLKSVEALKQASHNLKVSSANSNSSAIKALLELQIETNSILSNDPLLYNLSHHFTDLKPLFQTLQNSHGQLGPKSFLTSRVTSQEISRVAGFIESEIQSWIDRKTIGNLIESLRQSDPDEVLIRRIDQFKNRISQGFNLELQNLILKLKVFETLEVVLFESKVSKNVRESVAFAVAELIRFNKDVFVGQVLMGQTIRSLISLASYSSIKVLCSLIKSIKSPLVDEIESNNEIPKIICLLSSEDQSVLITAMDCVLEIGYFGRKVAIQAMLNDGLIEKLLELQRGELGGDLTNLGRFQEKEKNRGVNVVGIVKEEIGRRENKEMRFLESRPFANCVGRFAVQLEVGEGLRQREKRAFKQEILKRIREASAFDAESATIFAEVLWGSSP